ncbi:MarR family EPS-associated transcriptional regulator [Candidatus Omnitrophota bacterium]
MNEQFHQEEVLNLFKEIDSTPESTQRSLSRKLNISLGKTNYMLKSLIKRGLISIKNFSTKDGKLYKVKYFLTKEGLDARLLLTRHFLERKELEYNRLRKEYEDMQIKELNKKSI